MGILSAVTKIASKAVSKLTGSTAKATAKTVKRAVKAAPDFIFGDQAGTIAKAMKNTKGSIFTKVNEGAKAAVRATEKTVKRQGGNFFTRLAKNTVKIFTDVPKQFKAGIRAAKIAAVKTGKKVGVLSKLKSGLGGVGKGLLKKMPIIGSLLMIGFEIPNIYHAAKEEGIWAAVKETGKATARLAGMAAGSAIGLWAGGPVGCLAGAVAGEWLAGKLVGKTYDEKKEFLAENGVDEDAIKQLKEQGYSFEQIYDRIKNEAESAEIDNEAAQKQQQEVQEQQQTAQTQTQEAEPAAEEPAQGAVQETPAAEQPSAEAPVETVETPEEPAAETTTAVQGMYSDEGIAILKELGLTDDDITTLAQAGISIEDAVKMVVNVKTQGGSTAQTVQTQTSAVQPETQGETTVQQQNSNYFEPFQLPYNNTMTGMNTGYYNPYANDMYYKQLFGDTTSNLYGTNPISAQNSNTSAGTQDYLTDLYKTNGKLGYSA